MEIKSKEIKLVLVSEIKENPKNLNQHPEDQIARLAEIIKAEGFRVPLIVSNRSGLLVSGHGRLQASKMLGLETVPVVFQDFESEEQEFRVGVSDNAIASWAQLDLSGIHLELPNMNPFDVNLLGIRNFQFEPEIGPALTDEDQVPGKPEKPKNKLGDLWTLGGHRLLCGDSTNSDHVGKLMNGEKAVLWQSDPPYGISYVDEVANEKGQAVGYKPIANDDLQDEKLKEFILASINASLPFLEKNFAFYMWHAMKMQAYFSQAAAAAAGILFHRQIIWVKPQFVFGRGHYHWRHELCLMGWLQGNEPPFYGERNQSTVWEIGRENDKIHPTQKPVAIWEEPIKNHMKHGQIVYEPFCGSGSQVIAAEKNGVRCFAMELEPSYVDVILQRWSDYTGQDPVRQDGKKWSELKD